MATFYGTQATLRQAGTTVDASMSGGVVRGVIDEYVTVGTEANGESVYYGGLHLPLACTVVDAWYSNDAFGAHTFRGIRALANGTVNYLTDDAVGVSAAVHRPASAMLPLTIATMDLANEDGQLVSVYFSATAPTAGASLVACVMYVAGA